MIASASNIEAASVALAVEHAEAERAFVASVFCDHLRGVRVAQSCGVDAGHFASDDWRHLYLACEVCAAGRKSRARLMMVAELALKSIGAWWGSGPIAPPFCSLWNTSGLTVLAESRYHSPTEIRHTARALIDVAGRAAEARNFLESALSLMTNGAEVAA